MESLVFDLMQQENFEAIHFFQEKTTGLKAVIAIHDTTLGPAAGGIRMWNYASEMEAIQDAMGVVQAMRACLQALFGNPDLQGRTVAIQGAGAVGRAVAERLVQAGAVVTIADIDGERVEQVVADYGVNMAHPEEIAYLPVDI